MLGSGNQSLKSFRADLNRWFHESDLDVEQLAKVAFCAIDRWLDEETLGFKAADEGNAKLLYPKIFSYYYAKSKDEH